MICHKCRAVLYESAEELKSTEEIVQGYDGRCPTCGKKLSYTPKKVEVNPVDERIGSLVPEKKKPKRKKSRKKHKERLKKREYASYKPKLRSIWTKESV